MIVKSLWATVQKDPTFMRRVNGWLTIFWVVMIPISVLLGWITSVAYVSALSLWALVSGHWAAWQAARVEVAQERDREERRPEPRGGVNESARGGLQCGQQHTGATRSRRGRFSG
jgi:hypothetical protein